MSQFNDNESGEGSWVMRPWDRVNTQEYWSSGGRKMRPMGKSILRFEISALATEWMKGPFIVSRNSWLGGFLKGKWNPL